MKLFFLSLASWPANWHLQRSWIAAFSKGLILLTAIGFLVGCSTVGYYSQIVSGHMRIVMGKRPVAEVVSDQSINDGVKRRLAVAQRARQFGIEELGLPDNNSYTSFYDTGQNYVTWNVVAAEEFSFKPNTWCFPIAGCVSYRGYYAKEDAESYAKGLAEEGLDVAVNGATAYSTLGWFEDPILNTMLARSDPSIASLLFHELAHQQLYVGDDSTFNESYASFVEQEGLRQWQESEERLNPELKNSKMTEELTARKKRQENFIALLSDTRESLEELYDSALDADEMRQKKAERFDQMRDEYESLKESWGGYSGYDLWFSRKLNNARLVSVATYNDYIPAFEVLFSESGGTFEKFYIAARELSELAPEVRTEKMQALLARSPAIDQSVQSQ